MSKSGTSKPGWCARTKDSAYQLSPVHLLIPGLRCPSAPTAGMDKDCDFPTGVLRDGVEMSGIALLAVLFTGALCKLVLEEWLLQLKRSKPQD